MKIEEIDIRSVRTVKVNTIRFADAGDNTAFRLINVPKGDVVIEFTDDEPGIKSKEDAQNMIAALERAIKFGWFDK